MDHVVVGYMCRVDFECELGYVKDGNKVYPSIDDLKENHPMWEECGIVEVKVSLSKIIHEGI